MRVQFGHPSIICIYICISGILGQYVNPSRYLLVRTTMSELIITGRDSERTWIGVNGSRRAPNI